MGRLHMCDGVCAPLNNSRPEGEVRFCLLSALGSWRSARCCLLSAFFCFGFVLFVPFCSVALSLFLSFSLSLSLILFRSLFLSFSLALFFLSVCL
eukprot:COSAG05_NODE_1878_length_3911_cov_62.469576_1_plen_95_part_00